MEDIYLSFFETFKGNTSFYNELDLKEGKVEGGKLKYPVRTVKDEATPGLMLKHLRGDTSIGFCPLRKDNKVTYCAIDIDNYDEVKIKGILKVNEELLIPLLPFRSKSGGVHLYLFFNEPVEAQKAIEALNEYISLFSVNTIFSVDGVSKVEVFPKQKKLLANNLGSCLTLPYCGEMTYMVNSDMSRVDLESALSYIASSRVGVSDFLSTLSGAPLNDAPPCLQSLFLSRALGASSGRNNYLFSLSVYLKKKIGDSFFDELEDANNHLREPLEDAELRGIYSSVLNNDYGYKCKDMPCKQFCNKKLCRERDFGLKNKGSFSGVDFGVMRRYMASVPYYTWEIRLQGQESFTEVVFRDANSVLDQRNFITACMDKLSYAPYMQDKESWTDTVNKALSGIINIDINADSDDTELAVLRRGLFEYLQNYKHTLKSPSVIKAGAVYEGEGYLYFTAYAFSTFLQSKKIPRPGAPIKVILATLGCEEFVLNYESRGKTASIECWRKEVTDDLESQLSFYEDILEEEKKVIDLESEEYIKKSSYLKEEDLDF